MKTLEKILAYAFITVISIIISFAAAALSIILGTLVASFFEPLTDDQYYQFTIWTAVIVMIIFTAAVARLAYKRFSKKKVVL
jgi:hypothetical protein